MKHEINKGAIERFLRSVERLPKPDLINLKQAVGRSYKKATNRKEWISFMKTALPENTTQSQREIFFYVAGLKANQVLKKESGTVLAESALKSLYFSETDSTKNQISKLFSYSTRNNGKLLAKLNMLLERGERANRLNLSALLADLLWWDVGDRTKVKWATEIFSCYKDEEEEDSGNDSDNENDLEESE